MRSKLFYSILSLLIIFNACKEEEEAEIADHNLLPDEGMQMDDTLILNPYGYSPLSARLIRNYNIPVNLEIEITSKNPTAENLKKKYTAFRNRFDVPILGLYAAHNNQLRIRAIDLQGNVVKEEMINIQTDSLPDGMPEIIIDRYLPSESVEGMNLLSYWGIGSLQMPLIFDSKEEIRWYLDYSTHPNLFQLAYDNGIERLKNGNFYFGDISSGSIYEVDVYGKVVESWLLNGHDFHHNVQEKDDGNFLVTTSKQGSLHQNGNSTIEDFVIEIDRASGAIVREWDLKESLDEYRTSWTNQLSREPIDWFHGNAVIEGLDQQSIVVCGRTQGIVKLSNQNDPIWILSTHNGWKTNRDSVDLNQYLLQPIDNQGRPITDTSVLNGYTNQSNFEWAWYPHAPEYLPNGDLLVFDNGDNRNYSQSRQYSRAVIYRIDEQAMTIEQLWSYGKNRGTETFGQYVSDVDYLASKNNILFSPGFGTDNFGEIGGRVVEIDYGTKQVVFEALINPPPGSFVAFHRAERISLYK